MKNKSILIGVLVAIIIIVVVIAVIFINKGQKSTESTTIPTNDNNVENNIQETPKSEQEGTAGSNIPLKDNLEEAKYQIKVAMQKLFEETYGNEVVDARINVDKVYTDEEEEQEEGLKEKNLGPDEVAFSVSYELKIAENVTDTIKFTVTSGEFDEESRWVTGKSNVGILRKDGNNYKITDLGSGW